MFLSLSLIIFWIKESDTISHAIVIKIADLVPAAALITASLLLSNGKGLLEKLIYKFDLHLPANSDEGTLQ